MYAIIVSKPSQGDLSPASVSYTAGFYHIPVIGISSRDSAFSDKVSKSDMKEIFFYHLSVIKKSHIPILFYDILKYSRHIFSESFYECSSLCARNTSLEPEFGISDHDRCSFPIRYLFHNDSHSIYLCRTRKMKSGNKNFPFG